MISPGGVIRRPDLVVLSGATLLVALGHAVPSTWRHTHFRTNGHDLGIFDQAVWALSRLEAPATTIRLIPLPNLFGDHFHPIVMLLAPWYWIFGSPLVLLIAQAALFAGVVPLGFLVARQFEIPRWPAVILSVALGIHPGFTTAMLAEFHEIAFAPALLLTAVLLADRGHWRWYWLVLVLFLLTKESMGLYAALFGITLMLRRQWRVGVATLILGVGYFYSVTHFVMPRLAGQEYLYWRIYPELGGSTWQMIEHVIRHPLASLELLVSTPEKRRTLNLMLASFAYLPLLSWTMWPMMLLTLAERFWSSIAELWVFRHHYQVVMTTVFFVATVSVFRDLVPRRPPWRALKLVGAMLIFLTTTWTLLTLGLWNDPFESPPAEAIERWRSALRQIPSDARVSAQSSFVPHLSRRRTIYQFPRVRDAEYILLDPRTATWPLTPAEVGALQGQLPSLGWHLLWRQESTTVFQRSPDSRTPPTPPLWE